MRARGFAGAYPRLSRSMRRKIDRRDRHLLGRNLDRAMRISALVGDWRTDRREAMRRVLKVSLTEALRRIESGAATAKEATNEARRGIAAPRNAERSAGPTALAGELLLIFLTALSHDGSGQLGPLREYTFRCVQPLLRTASKTGQACLDTV